MLLCVLVVANIFLLRMGVLIVANIFLLRLDVAQLLGMGGWYFLGIVDDVLVVWLR